MLMVCYVAEQATFLVYHALTLGYFFFVIQQDGDGFFSWLTMCSYVDV